MITNQQIRDRMGPELYSVASSGDIESMRHRMEREEAAMEHDSKTADEQYECRLTDMKYPVKGKKHSGVAWIPPPDYVGDISPQKPWKDCYAPLGVARPEDCSVAPIGVARGEPETVPFNAPQPSPLQRMYDALTKDGVFEIQHDKHNPMGDYRIQWDDEKGCSYLAAFTVKAKVTEENVGLVCRTCEKSAVVKYTGSFFVNPSARTITITARLQPNGSIDVKARVE